MSIESVMPSNHLILCYPLLLLPSVFPNIKVFSSESALWIQWPKYWSFSYSIMNYHVIISLFYLNDELWWTPDRHCVYRWMCSMLVVQKGEWCWPWPQGSLLGNRPGCWVKGNGGDLTTVSPRVPGGKTQNQAGWLRACVLTHWILIMGGACGPRPLISCGWYNLKTALGSGIALSNIVYTK